MFRPDSHLERKLAAIRLVIMDIDGTLVNASQRSINNVLNQLRRLKPLGIRFSIATGRTIFGAKTVADQLLTVGARTVPMITYNGSVVFNGRDFSLLEQKLISPAAFKPLIQFCRSRRLSPLAYACRTTFDFHPIELVYSEGNRREELEFNGMPVMIVPDLSIVSDQFVAVLIETESSSAAASLGAEMARHFGEVLRITTSGGPYVEIGDPEGTKLNGMITLARMCHIDPSLVMSIGDNLNDLEMIRASGIGAAVSNATQAVKDAALLNCTRPAAEGVVEALRALTRAARNARIESHTLAEQ